MKKTCLNLLLLAAFGGVQVRADFNPVALTPGSFTADVIVEKTAAKAIADYTTATMDNVGTNNTANTWYENGYFTGAPWTGVPAQGSTFVAFSDVNRQYQMPPDYATNDALFMATHAGLTTGTLTLSAAAPFSTISIMGASGNGPVVLNYKVHHSGGADETGSISVPDWTGGGSTFAYLPNGRINMDSGAVNALSYTNGNSVRIQYVDIALTDAVNPVTSVDFTYASGGRVALFGLSGSTDNVVFTPVTVTGFNRDMIVEATAPRSGYNGGANVTMENPSSGVANAGNGWYEQGFNRGALATGVPTNGTSYTVGATRTYTMAPDYKTNCVFFISANPGTTAATITLNTAISVTGLSFSSSAGNGPTVINVTVHHSADPDETASISVLDWFNAAAADFNANGRYVKESLTFNNVNGGTGPKIFHNDVAIAGLSPVTSIDLTYASGGRAMIFALSGTTGGNYSPIAVSGYNADGIVERTLPALPLPLTNATTVSMDGGTNNTANTWYERGYYHEFPNTGFPPAGSTINSLAQPDHHYVMPTNYAANNAVFIDAVFTNANLTIASPATYSALSFLSATANGTVTNQAIMQYADGTSETNTFNSLDWFGNTPVAFYANGRVNLNNRTINSDLGHNAAPYNPRLYEAQFALGNVGSPVTNILLRFLNPTNSTGRLVVFAVSATAGAVPPIIASTSISANSTYEGSNVVLNAVITGGTAPITYQWQRGTNGVYVDLANGGTISGATTTNMVISGVTFSDVADYRLVASNITGPVSGGIATLSLVLSGLPDVTAPTDQIMIIAGSTPGAEAVNHAIDNQIQKYLNNDSDAVAPFDIPVGFIVKPALGNTVVSALRFYTANDHEERDPADYVLEGSVDGSAFSTIASGALALPGGRNTVTTDALIPFTQNMQEVRFANTAGYNYYRLTFNNVKNNATANSMQIGEVEFLGVLNPNPPPVFTLSASDVTANEGTTATFKALAAGVAPITYQWYDVTAGDPGVLLTGKTSPNLVLNNVTGGQSGNKYRVVATNPNGSVTNPSPVLPGAMLTVNVGPITVVQDLPAELLAYAGRSLSLAATVAGTNPDYQWQSNGVNLVEGGRLSGVHSNVLTISNLQFEDAASYLLQSSNSFGGPVPTAAANVYVTAAPGFHTNGVSWVLNAVGGPDSPYFSGPDVLSLTTAGNQRRSAWFTTPMNIDAFSASFIYQDTSTAGADGVAFVIQNQGTNALGGGGGGLGYQSIPSSAAVMFNIFGTSGVSFRTNGSGGAPYIATAPVDISNGDPIQVKLDYDGANLQIVLSNIVNSSTFSTNLAVGRLAEAVGTNVAYIGFTAATGGIGSSQQVGNFQYVPIPTIVASDVANDFLLSWPASIGGYGVQVNPDLTSGSWSTVPGFIGQTNGLNQKSIGVPVGQNFYRLALPLP